MKKLFTLLALVITLITTAQAPQGFNYQATVRNSSGNLIVNQNVLFKFNIMLNSQTSLPVYSETHQAPTDDLGQVNLVIGTGTPTTGTFAAINWGTGTHFLAIELNTGNGFVAMGTTQLLSVPYALYANKSAETAALQLQNNDLQNQVTTLQNQITALQQLLLPTITTDRVEAVTGSSARVYFSYTVPDAFSGNHQVGLVWSTSPNPQVSDHYQGHVSGETITGLTTNTTYYLKAVFDNGNNRYYYGNEVSFTTTNEHFVGELFGGGIVVSVWDTDGVQHGLIASLTNLSSGIPWTTSSNYSRAIGTSARSFDDGFANTNAIVAQAGAGTDYAAGLCKAYNAGGYTDWYLPAMNELQQCYNSRQTINTVLGSTNGFQSYLYWSSTESDYNGYAWTFIFFSGAADSYSKSATYCVRAVRAF